MYFEEIGSEKKIHGVKVVPAQKPCVVNVLPSLQSEREGIHVLPVKGEAKQNWC